MTNHLDANTVTIIIAVSAIFSPVITAIINAILQLRLKRLEVLESRYRDIYVYRRSVFERYLLSIGKYATDDWKLTVRSYGEAYALAYAHSPESVRLQMLLFDQAVKSNDSKAVRELLPSVASSVAEIIDVPDCRKYKEHYR